MAYEDLIDPNAKVGDKVIPFKENTKRQYPSWYQELLDSGKLIMSGDKVRTTSRENPRLIVKAMPDYKNCIRFDEFNKMTVITDIPKLKIDKGPLTDYAIQALGAEIERKTGLYFKTTVLQNGLDLLARENIFNPVKEWIETEAWDNKPRAETLFIDSLGAENTHYVRAVTRAWLLELVSRVYSPGAKADLVPMLSGKQGIGKSRLLAKICPDPSYFTDSLLSIGKSKDEFEVLQGKLIVEFAELAQMRGKSSDIRKVKNFITNTTDTYRNSYGKVASDHPRTCVFIGTTNETEFLIDRTGNRRFCPIACTGKGEITEDRHYYQQILAEAKTWFDRGDKPILDAEAEATQKRIAEEYMEVDLDEENITEFLEMKVPDNWDQLSSFEQHNFFKYRNEPEQRNKVLAKKIDGRTYRLLNSFTTADCMNIVFGIDPRGREMNQYRRLARKIRSVVESTGEFESKKNLGRTKNKRGYKRLV